MYKNLTSEIIHLKSETKTPEAASLFYTPKTSPP